MAERGIYNVWCSISLFCETFHEGTIDYVLRPSRFSQLYFFERCRYERIVFRHNGPRVSASRIEKAFFSFVRQKKGLFIQLSNEHNVRDLLESIRKGRVTHAILLSRHDSLSRRFVRLVPNRFFQRSDRDVLVRGLARDGTILVEATRFPNERPVKGTSRPKTDQSDRRSDALEFT